MTLDGWTCPKCQRIWGPLTPGCYLCNEALALAGAVPVVSEPLEPADTTVRRALAERSSPRTALRAALSEAAADRLAAGYSPDEVAEMIRVGENPDV